jgi:hypothetical protein
MCFAMITIQDVEDAQKKWGQGIVEISSVYSEGGDYVKRAELHIDSLYDYKDGSVLFKPTFASEVQFRSTFESALSYFVGGNGVCSEDTGFAIKGWTKVRFQNDNVIIHGSTALAMGNYFFTTAEGDEVKVEYSFGYTKDSEGNLRICLHHSSVPSS